jgi:tryptophan synthase alpha chain
MSRYSAMFDRLGSEGALGAFVMLGDPVSGGSLSLLDQVVEGGADMIELGIPFSDPVADGAVIQAAAARALARNVSVDQCLDLVAHFRVRNPHIPIGVLTYANIVVARGTFMRDLASAGVDSLLLADVPSIAAGYFVSRMIDDKIEPVLIAAANSSDESIGRIAAHSKSYTYCVSRVGITGTHATGVFDAGLVARLRSAGAPPPIFGFGISAPAHVREALRAGGRGVICGSAIVDLAAREGDVSAFVASLKRSTGNESAAQ